MHHLTAHLIPALGLIASQVPYAMTITAPWWLRLPASDSIR